MINKCYKCHNENLKVYKIKNRGYGSIYDGLILTIYLCDNCKPKDFELWINEIPKYEGYMEVYQYEEELYKFLKSFNIESQEKIFNSTAIGESLVLPKDEWIAWATGENNIEEILNKLKEDE